MKQPQAMDAVKTAKQQLLSFLLRHGLRYENGQYWTQRHRRWLAEMRKFPYPHQQLAFEEYKRAVAQAEDRVITLNKAIEDAITGWHCTGAGRVRVGYRSRPQGQRPEALKLYLFWVGLVVL